jgi:hypothetical protein
MPNDTTSSESPQKLHAPHRQSRLTVPAQVRLGRLGPLHCECHLSRPVLAGPAYHMHQLHRLWHLQRTHTAVQLTRVYSSKVGCSAATMYGAAPTVPGVASPSHVWCVTVACSHKPCLTSSIDRAYMAVTHHPVVPLLASMLIDLGGPLATWPAGCLLGTVQGTTTVAAPLRKSACV